MILWHAPRLCSGDPVPGAVLGLPGWFSHTPTARHPSGAGQGRAGQEAGQCPHQPLPGSPFEPIFPETLPGGSRSLPAATARPPPPQGAALRQRHGLELGGRLPDGGRAAGEPPLGVVVRRPHPLAHSGRWRTTSPRVPRGRRPAPSVTD